MYILAPITADTQDTLRYWVPVDDDRIQGIWNDVIKTGADFINERFPETAKQILSIPIRYIDPEEAADCRADAIRVNFGVKGTTVSEYMFMGMKLLDHIIATKSIPKSGSDKMYSVYVGRRVLKFKCEPKICFIAGPNMRMLEANIYSHFMAVFCKRIESIFIDKFDQVASWRDGKFIVNCPKSLSAAKKKMNESEIADYLDADLVILRMNNVTFNRITNQNREMVKNHAHIIAEALNRRDYSFVVAVNNARKDGLELTDDITMYFPTLAVWFDCQFGNVFCAFSIYKDGQLYDEFNLEMYHKDPHDYALGASPWLFRWYDILSDMAEVHNDNLDKGIKTKWSIVMTDLIHG